MKSIGLKFGLILLTLMFFSQNIIAQSGGKDKANALMQSYMNAMGMGSNSTAKKTYHFDALVKMEMTAQGNEKVTMKILLNQTNNDYALYMDGMDSGENQTSGFIYDMENHIMIMLADDGEQKTAVTMPIPEEMNDEMNEYEDDSDASDFSNDLAFNYKKTGRTKNIAGNFSSEYVYENDESRVEIWTTTKIDFDLKSAFKNMNQISAFVSGGMLPSGFLMELHATDKASNETYTIKFLEFDDHANETIDLSDYMMVNAG